MGPGSGALAGTVVDFTQGDLDGDGRNSGMSPVRLRGTTVSTLDFRTQTFEAGGTLSLELRETGDAMSALPLFAGSGSFAVRVTGSGSALRTVLAANGLEAMVHVQGQHAGVSNGSLLLVLPGSGYALSLSATAAIAVPGLAGTSVFGDVTVELNRSGQAINESIVVGGKTPMVPTKELGDMGFFYHSNEGREVVGIVEVCALSHPDSTAEGDARWDCVDIRAVCDMPKPVT